MTERKLSQIIGYSTALEIWNVLNKIYSTMSMACLIEIHTNMKNPKNKGMIAMEYIMQMNHLYIGMTILRVFRVTHPVLPLLG